VQGTDGGTKREPTVRMGEAAKWDFWIDRGGTFTDVVARRPDGSYAVIPVDVCTSSSSVIVSTRL
jgi:hypothetical protein